LTDIVYAQLIDFSMKRRIKLMIEKNNKKELKCSCRHLPLRSLYEI